MSDIQKKTFIVIGMSVLMLIAFTYIVYYLFGSMTSSIKTHAEKRKELLMLEEKEKQSQRLRKELEEVSLDSEMIKAMFLGTDLNDTVNFTIQLENLSRELMLAQDVRTIKTASNLNPSKGKDLPGDTVINTFPHIVFGVDLEGSYVSLVKFLERLNNLPYYLNVERLDISEGSVREEVVSIKAFVQLKVFTNEDKNKE